MTPAAFTIDIETWGEGADAYDPDAVTELVDALVSRGAEGAVTSAGGLAGGVGAIFSVEGLHRDQAAACGSAVRDVFGCSSMLARTSICLIEGSRAWIC